MRTAPCDRCKAKFQIGLLCWFILKIGRNIKCRHAPQSCPVFDMIDYLSSVSLVAKLGKDMEQVKIESASVFMKSGPRVNHCKADRRGFGFPQKCRDARIFKIKAVDQEVQVGHIDVAVMGCE